MSTKIADGLKKGGVVEITARPYVTAYTDINGNAKATLHCHVQTIKLHLSNGSSGQNKPKKAAKKGKETVADNLPF